MKRRTTRRAAWLFTVASCAACGGGDWKSRLQERFESHSVEHPLMDRAREVHTRALQAEQAENTDAQTWALAADRFLSAAVVRVQSAQLREQIATNRAEVESLTEQVEALEQRLAVRFAADKHDARGQWLGDAVVQAYTHAEEYEAKRFRSRNEDAARLKNARDEVFELALLQLAGARALEPSQPLEELQQTLEQCRVPDTHLQSLDCINHARWRIQEAFARARRKHLLTHEDTLRIKAFLTSKHASNRWQNDSLAIVSDDVSIASWRAILEQVQGPLQLHGSKAAVDQLRKRLRSAGATEERFAQSALDDVTETVVYLLAYPRPVSPQPK